MDSVMYTGTCLRPSCTATVCPTMSGMIVERRDQVLMTFFSPFEFRLSTFRRRWSSTKGPFFRERGISCLNPLPPPRQQRRRGLRSAFLGVGGKASSYLRAPRVRRRRTISLSDGWSFLRVRPSGLPQGDTGWRPPDDLPSPPP